MNQQQVDDAVKRALRDLLDQGAKPEQIADAALANGLAVAETVAGPLDVARRLYLLSLRFADAAGLKPAVKN